MTLPNALRRIQIQKMANRLDIILLGATGFTGLNCIPHIHKLTKFSDQNYTWGIAGRSEQKLRHVLKEMEKRVGANFSHIPVIICNTEDDDSLYNMAKQARLVINCVGPYVLYGERVVDACLKAGTHHIDVSGEPTYMELMQLKKHKTAEEKGVYVISACGLDSIPPDLGVVYADQNFEGVINSVTTYLQFSTGGKKSGAAVNIGTWASIVNSIPLFFKEKEIRRKLFPQKLPSFKPKLKKRILPHKSSLIDGWIVPFPGADEAVISRSQRYFYEVENKRPIQVDTLLVFNSIFYIFLILLMAPPVLLLCFCKWGRNLLIKYPEIFSFGYFSNKPPSQETVENASFQLTLVANGWSEKLPVDDQYKIPCDKQLVVKVRGKNPVYGSTCICLVGAAVTILREKEKLAGNGKGGVYPPGAAFAKTNLIKLLNDNKVTFEIVSKSKI